MVKIRISVEQNARVARGGWVWCCVPVPLPLPLGAEGHVGHDTRLSGWFLYPFRGIRGDWGMVFGVWLLLLNVLAICSDALFVKSFKCFCHLDEVLVVTSTVECFSP